MEEKLKEVSNKDLLQLYRIVMEHLEQLESEKKKLEEEDAK